MGLIIVIDALSTTLTEHVIRQGFLHHGRIREMASPGILADVHAVALQVPTTMCHERVGQLTGEGGATRLVHTQRVVLAELLPAQRG